MSDDLSAVHAQTSAIFEMLYDERGQPDELNDAFTQEYFKLVKDHVKLDAEEAEAGPLVVESAEVKLSKPDSGLIELYARAEGEKFIVSKLRAVKVLQGRFGRVGQLRGNLKGSYFLTKTKTFIIITIVTASSKATFIGDNASSSEIYEEGKGEWEKV